MANVVGEFLSRLGNRPEVSPVQVPSRLVDDPISTLEQAVVDLKLAHGTKDVPSILKQVGLLLYYTVLMAKKLQLHPYLSSTYLWIHSWQLSKIYVNLGKAEHAYEMVPDASMKEVKDGYVIASSKSSQVLRENALDDKADIVLMTPVESLLILVPFRLHMPVAGLDRERWQPEKGDEGQEMGKSQELSASSSAL